MKVRDVMITDAKVCGPDTNLAAATELMWTGDCGFLPVVDEGNHVLGVITDRDICIALGTRGWVASDIAVKDAISGKVFMCLPDIDIQDALSIMRTQRVRRLVAVDPEGRVAGILSLDDAAAAAEPAVSGRRPDLSLEDVASTLKAICNKPLVVTERTARPATAAV